MQNQQDQPAYLVMLGMEDWECEKRLLLAGRSHREPFATRTEANA